MFIFYFSEAASVRIVPLLEGITSQSCISADDPVLVHHLGLVHHLFGQAVAIHGTGGVNSAVAPFNRQVRLTSLHFIVVFGYCLLHIWHTFIRLWGICRIFSQMFCRIILMINHHFICEMIL